MAVTSPATGRPTMAALGGYEQAIERLNRLPPIGRLGNGASLSPRRRALRRRAGPHVLHAQERHANRRHPRANRRLERATDRSPIWKRPVCWRRWFIRPATAATPAASSRVFTTAGAGRPKRRSIESPPICGSTCRSFCDNGAENLVFREDAQTLAERLVTARGRHRLPRSALQSASLWQQLPRAQQRRPCGTSRR